MTGSALFAEYDRVRTLSGWPRIPPNVFGVLLKPAVEAVGGQNRPCKARPSCCPASRDPVGDIYNLVPRHMFGGRSAEAGLRFESFIALQLNQELWPGIPALCERLREFCGVSTCNASPSQGIVSAIERGWFQASSMNNAMDVGQSVVLWIIAPFAPSC